MKTTNSTSRRHLTASAAALCAFIFFPALNHAATLAYTVTDLGTLSGGISGGFGINASGQVAGFSASSNFSPSHAVRWTGAMPTDLGINGSGFGINITGQVAGEFYSPGNTFAQAARWTGSTMALLNNLGGTVGGSGYGINASGQVAGIAYSANGSERAVRWTGTTPADLGTLGGSVSEGYGINDSGQVAGIARLPGDLISHAARWTGTTAQDLGTLGGQNSLGFAINASGQVAGLATKPGFLFGRLQDISRPVVWTGTTAADLGDLPGGAGGEARGINTAGNAIGISYSAIDGTTQTPFLYIDGTMYDLNSLILPGSGVTSLGLRRNGNGINDLNQIAAFGIIGGQEHALRLDPVAAPEPASAVLLLGSAAAFLARRRRSAAGV